MVSIYDIDPDTGLPREPVRADIAPDPSEWTGMADTFFTASRGFDDLWHLDIGHPAAFIHYVHEGGESVPNPPDGDGTEADGVWSNDLSKVNCAVCKASPWWEIASTRPEGGITPVQRA